MLPRGHEKSRQGSGEVDRQLGMPSGWPDRASSSAVRISKPVADRPEALDDRLATAEYLPEHLLLMLFGSEIQTLGREPIEAREVGSIGVVDAQVVEYVLAHCLNESPC